VLINYTEFSYEISNLENEALCFVSIQFQEVSNNKNNLENLFERLVKGV